MKLLLYSKGDPAGVNIASHIVSELSFRESYIKGIKTLIYEDIYLISVEEELINAIIEIPNVEYSIFLSKHRSEAGKNCLTTHTPGNLCNRADMGGNPNEVAISNPPIQSILLKEIHKLTSEYKIDVPVTVEATHHGPTSLDFPVTFVEIGSDENAWKNNIFGEIIAKSVIHAISLSINLKPSGLGMGGGHYSEKFTNKIINENVFIGHIIPKYAMMEEMNPLMIEICMKRTLGECSKIYVDWKGTPSIYKEYLKSIKGIEIIKI
ncbi:MAG: hypothetical protein NZ922_03560 [Candidatus Methanomethyliaceae archaeon]|nr:hypothetical protein [Candidatus Methanomethyliaceae archaeon]MDW7970673.1 D-aminoacyl-tRNA deacylase [Nitrososphaerota archaeon]